MFATIRFYIEPQGQYIEQHFMLQTGEVIVASQIAKSICDGYTLGTGFSAYVLSVHGTSNGDTKNTVTSPVDMAHFGNELREHFTPKALSGKEFVSRPAANTSEPPYEKA